MYELLDKIESPADIKGLTTGQLRTLCAELRQYIIETCATNPGHLAASLGAVELIVGVHYVYDTPADQLVFDVGHQAYAHKILTGRREAFRTMRTKGGISGFPNRSESPYDAFGVGHSSTSISAALGLAEAARMQGRHDKVVALIGDGAMTGGLAFEGLNNAGASRADLLVILSTVDGLLRMDVQPHRRVPCIEKLDKEAFKLVNPVTGGLSKGGMDSKLRSAQIAVKAGCAVVIANGRKANSLTDVVAGKDVGTLILGATV